MLFYFFKENTNSLKTKKRISSYKFTPLITLQNSGRTFKHTSRYFIVKIYVTSNLEIFSSCFCNWEERMIIKKQKISEKSFCVKRGRKAVLFQTRRPFFPSESRSLFSSKVRIP